MTDIFIVSHLLSWQHFSILTLAVLYTVGLYWALRNRSQQAQSRVLLGLAVICVLLFAWRWRVLFTGQELEPGEWGGLLPLELCNIGAFVLPFTVYFKKRFLFVFSFFLNLLGAVLALLLIPEAIHQRFFLHPQFLDFFIIHVNLVAIPFAMVACGWYKLRLKDSVLAVTMFYILGAILLVINLFLAAVNWPGDHTNYLFVMGPRDFPVLDQLFNLIPIPLLYLVPLIPVFLLYSILVLMPIVKKGEWGEQFDEMLRSFKTLGF
ncbi:MAG: YwaF family protein [Defluviitaleaceae bacterium]|nr:YwaF family protein [Defluviitaleaceae bacterium]